jgi:hypothetical protein
MTYAELADKLQRLEKITGLYLYDPCVDAENVGANPTDWALYDAALCAAEDRAQEAGHDLHELLKQL